jgi:2-polyprenyl-6-methoxyphenol hydroxylase-like FAD-dependent oxidoreductase
MAPGPAITAGPPSHYFCPFGRMLGYPLPAQNLVYVAIVLHDGPARHVEGDEARDMLRDILDSMTAPYAVELRKRLTDDQQVLYRPYEWLWVPPPWHKGRVLLIGDAAHATTAHMAAGGGMAMEDAAVLAQSVAAAPTLDAAFQAFMDRRRARVRRVVDSSLARSRREESGAKPHETAAYGAEVFKELARPY